ncbi:MAG: FtsK/SpoIIIE domain-containing protein [Limisphaerales bacterium]
MTASKFAGVDKTLDLLDRLTSGAADCRARAERLESDRQRRAARSESQQRVALRELERELRTAEEQVREADAGREAELRSRHERRAGWIRVAAEASRKQAEEEITQKESREVFRLQRELLQVGKDQEAGRKAADGMLAERVTEWETAHAGAEALVMSVDRAFSGYGSLKGLLRTPLEESVNLPAALSAELINESAKLSNSLEQALGRFRRSPLPWAFSVVSPWWMAGLSLVVVVAAVLLLPRFTDVSLDWKKAGIGLGGFWFVLLVLHGLGGRLAKSSATELAKGLTRLRTWMDAAHQAARTEHEQELGRADAEATQRNETLQAAYNATRAQAECDRGDAKARLTSQEARAQAVNDRQLERLLAESKSDTSRRLEALHAETTSKRESIQGGSGAGSTAQGDEDPMGGVLRDWQSSVLQTHHELVEDSTTAKRAFPVWDDPSWDTWEPTTDGLWAAPLGRLEVDLGETSGGWPADASLVKPDPARLELPLLLTLPDRGSVLFETRDHGRTEALTTLNNLVLRLLMSAPPGKVLFTILDPVGLGESFAGLMHLTDHEDRLVNRKIWTQQEQIEQRLADLNEHIEKVTQIYLRNEYRTIAEYNEQAGRIAEPYHFLVVADFPVNFSDLAVRRLLSIAASGPRCGVFTLVHWDTRRAAPLEFVAEDLRLASLVLQGGTDGFTLPKRRWQGMKLVLEKPPEAARETRLLQELGRRSIDSNRVEMPFEQIAPKPQAFWSSTTVDELRVAIGVTGATKLQQLALGKGTRQHALVAGKTGSGKSTLFHVLVTNLSLWCSPEQVEFYLVDFKKGVEFKCYASHRLPHARVVAIESDREFGLSVLQRVDQELQRRGDLFRELGVQDLAGYQRTGKGPLPRTLLIIDEFQEFFTEDDRVSQAAALLLDRLVRQGRAFGIHVLLGSQTLGGAYTLARTTLGQMVVRIALQCNQADALLIMDDDNPAPRLLSRPGEAIYNDASGAVEGNSPFQIVWLSEQEREGWLRRLADYAQDRPEAGGELVVFEGNAPADIQDNRALMKLLAGERPSAVSAGRIWLGAPNSIKGPTEVVFHRQSGNNLLVVGQNDESTLAMVMVGLMALGAQHGKDGARVLLFDASPAGSPHRESLERVAAGLPLEVEWVGNANLEATMTAVSAELERRSADEEAAAKAPPVYLVVHHLERFKALRYEDDFSFSLDEKATKSPGAVLHQVLTEGTSLGIPVFCVCDSWNSTSRFLNRKAISEFELRVLFQMSAGDSASLMDEPRASTLGLHRAVLFNAQEGSMETFRPYAKPTA